MATLMRRSFPTLSDLFDDFVDERGLTANRNRLSMPAVNVSERADHFQIDVAAPGFNKEDFNINVDNNVLTISSEKEIRDEDADGTQGRREFAYGSFRRSFNLPDSVDPDKISASYENGVLKITAPKREETKPKPPRRIDIS